MALDRERYYSALLERLRTKVTGLRTVTRRPLTSDQLESATAQPALVLRVAGCAPENEFGMPAIWVLTCWVGLYARNSARDGTADATLNGLVDQIEAALEVQPGEVGDRQTTLGGLVEYAWISGEVEMEPGEHSDQGFALVPIEMRVFDPT